MKNIWKWILGIVLVVVVVGGLAGAVFVAHNMMAARMANRQVSAAPGNPSQPPGGDNPKNGPTQRGFPGWRNGPGRGPMMNGGRFGVSPFRGRVPFRGGFPFGPGLMILGGLMRLVPLALVLLLVVGAYLLGKRANVPQIATVAPIPTHACPKCGEPVQDGSKYCPSCGKKQ